MALRGISMRGGLSACVMVLLGGLIAWQSTSYRIGSLVQMGPGFFPYYCGLLLAALGCLYFLAAFFCGESGSAMASGFSWQRLRGWCFIFLGMVAFIVLGEHAGFLPASFALVFLSSMGSTEFRVLPALILSTAVTALGILVFIYLLGIQIPIFA